MLRTVRTTEMNMRHMMAIRSIMPISVHPSMRMSKRRYMDKPLI